MFSLKLAIIPLQWFCCWKVLRQESSLSLQVPMAHGMNKKVTFSQVSRLLNSFLSNSTSLKIARGISNERSLECFENCKKHKCTFTASKAANKLICSQSWFGLLRNWHQIQPWAKAKMKSKSFLFLSDPSPIIGYHCHLLRHRLTLSHLEYTWLMWPWCVKMPTQNLVMLLP